MSFHRSEKRAGAVRPALAWIGAWAVVAAATGASAQEEFVYAGELIHPGCIHALAMEEGDKLPVTTAVSLEGCATSERSRAEIRYEADDLAVIEDDALLGGGSFAYRVISQLDNGIFGLAIRRRHPDGSEHVSLAAVDLVTRPMVQKGKIVQVQLVEVLGELWIPEMQLTSFRSAKNRVHFVVGRGSERVERDFDFTRLGRMRR